MSRRPDLRWLAALLGALIVALLYLQVAETAQSSGRRVGFSSTAEPAGGLRVSDVVPGLAGEKAGLRRGDLLVTVGAQHIHGQADYDLAAAHFVRGLPVVFGVEREGRALSLPVVPGAPFPWSDAVVNLVVCLAYLTVGLLALPLAPNDLRARLLFLFAGAVALEFALPVNPIGSPSLGPLVNVVSYALAGLQVGLELHLASALPTPPAWLRRRRWLAPAFYCVGALVGVFLVLAYLADLRERPLWPGATFTSIEVLNDVVLPLWAIAVAALLFHNTLRQTEPRRRQQGALVLLGVLPWSAYVLAGPLLALRGIEAPGWLSDLQPWALLVYPVAVFVAVFRYRLFNLEGLVRRSLVYTLLTALLLLVFYAVLGAGGALFSEWIEGGHGSVWVVSAATLLLGLLFAPLRAALQRLIERRFFPERHALRQRLIALAGELPALGQVPRMGRHLVQRLSEIFGLRSAALLLADPKSGLLVSVAASGDPRTSETELSLLLSPEDAGMDFLRQSRRPLPATVLAAKSAALAQRLHAAHAELAVPLLAHDRMVGVLLLGGRAAPAEELELLNLVAQHAATVFENARLFESATYEGLTGLLRREAILDVLEKELHRAVRYQRPLTIGMADLDHFKRVNDTWGHLAGDLLLKRVAAALAAGLRGTDSIGRYGGEEFLLVLPETQLDGAAAVAEKIRNLVEETATVMDDGTVVRLTISIGLATLADVQGPITPAALLAVADRALYRAKEAGRNRVEPALAV